LAARDSHQTKPNDIYKKDYLSFIALQRYPLFFILNIFERYLSDFCC